MGALEPDLLKPNEKITLNPSEKQIIFDWSPERRQKVVYGSKMKLRAFLTEERRENKHVDERVAAHVNKLWTNVVDCFQDSSKDTSPLLLNGEEIISFKPNILPTHSEYHVAKVLTLSSQLFDNALPLELKTQENALAVSLATIVHDVGSLLQGDETGPQEKMYRFHELRAIALVDKVVNAIYGDKQDHQRLKNKVKILIAATVPKWNLDFSPQHKTTINKLLDPTLNPPITYEKMIDDLFLKPDTADDSETKIIKDNLRNQADELYKTFDGLRKSGDMNAIREMRELTHLMGAADHGAYMLEPSNIAEVFGLWQEQQTEWLDQSGKLVHRSFTPGADTSYTWLTSKFTDVQWNEFGSMLQSLGINPFASDLSIHKSKQIADHVRSILRDNKSPQDALSRVEGAFSPVELNNLAHTLGLENNADIKNAIIIFSHKFAHRFAEPHNFDALSTDVLKLMYEKTSSKPTFLKEVFEAIIDNSIPELAKDGTLNIHIAPFAYGKDVRAFTEFISEACVHLPDEKRNRIKTIFFTVREGQSDSVQAIVTSIKGEDQPPFGVALGGIPKDSNEIASFLSTMGLERDSVIHFGLEKKYSIMEKRLQTLLKTVKDAGRPDVLLSHLSVHIDDGYEHFNVYIKNHPEDKELLNTLIKSVSPLGYLLTRGKEGFDNYYKFTQNFKGAIPGSNNASMKGGYRIAVENLVQVLMNEGIINQ